jgi:hypothetical protein
MTRRDFGKPAFSLRKLRENTCTIASGDYSTPVSQRWLALLKYYVTELLLLLSRKASIQNNTFSKYNKLLGWPGDHPDAHLVWQRWGNFNTAHERDVTNEYSIE